MQICSVIVGALASKFRTFCGIFVADETELSRAYCVWKGRNHSRYCAPTMETRSSCLSATKPAVSPPTCQFTHFWLFHFVCVTCRSNGFWGVNFHYLSIVVFLSRFHSLCFVSSSSVPFSFPLLLHLPLLDAACFLPLAFRLFRTWQQKPPRTSNGCLEMAQAQTVQIGGLRWQTNPKDPKTVHIKLLDVVEYGECAIYFIWFWCSLRWMSNFNEFCGWRCNAQEFKNLVSERQICFLGEIEHQKKEKKTINSLTFYIAWLLSNAKTLFLGTKKHIKKKHVNKIFTGLSRDFGGILFMCFSPP